MGKPRVCNYTEEQKKWIIDNSKSRIWKDQKEFTEAFNERFGTEKSVDALSSWTLKRGILITTHLGTMSYTEEQKQWIVENAQAKVWKNAKEFVDAFNEKFQTNRTLSAMNTWMNRYKITISTYHNSTVYYTDEMENWLINNFNNYPDYVSMAKDFNELFNTDKSNWAIRRHCIGTLKLLETGNVSSVKRGNRTYTKGNAGMFVKGQVGHNGLPVGTIRYHNVDGRPYIKVMDCDGKCTNDAYKRHSFQEPFWKPLQKKIWEDHYGEVPEGYMVCSLNGNPHDTDVKNIGIITRGAAALMAKNGWWSEEKGITATGIVWCNLYKELKKQNALIVTED